jgi:polysaccharide pyruvyl transferase WcaK-like protein
VVGGYGYRNVGDEAILAGLVSALAGHRMTVVSRMPAETAARHGVRSVPVTAAVAELARHRSLVIGGGGLFGRDMGALGRMLPAYGLFASGLGRTVAILGVGIDRDLPVLAAQGLQRLARRAAQVMVRDQASLHVLEAWGVDADIGPDLSSWVEPASPATATALLRLAGIDTRKPVVGLTLTAVNPSLTDAVLAAVGDAMDAFPDIQFAFIPMSQHPFVAGHNDLLLGRRLRDRQPRLKLVEGWTHPSEVMALHGQLSVLVGMRYHSLLFADRGGVPMIPIAYADKVTGWLAERDQAAVEPRGADLIHHLDSRLGAEVAS